MKKTWLYGAFAGLALLATACGNKTAAPDYNQPMGTKIQQYGTNAAHRLGTYGTMHDGTTNYYGTGYNGYGTVGTTGYNGTGLAGTTGNRTGLSGTAGTGYNGTGLTGTTGTGYNGTGLTGTTGAGYNGTGLTGAAGTGYNGTGLTGTAGTGYNGTGLTGNGTSTYGATGNTYNNNGYNTGGLTGFTGYGGTGYRGAGTYSAYGTTNNAGLYTRYATVPGQSMYQSTRMNTAQNNMPSMGYAKIDAVHARTYSTAHSRVYVDRNALAKAVADVTNSVPGIRSSTVLVTDEEIFVGCTTDQKNAHDSKNKARMNAMSIAPRYYKVYVTDDPGMIAELTRVASTTTHANATMPQNDSQINALIKRFGGMTDREESTRMGTRSDMHRTTGMK